MGKLHWRRRFKNRVDPEGYANNVNLDNDERPLPSNQANKIHAKFLRLAHNVTILSLIFLIIFVAFVAGCFLLHSIFKFSPPPPPHLQAFYRKVRKQELEYRSSLLGQPSSDNTDDNTSPAHYITRFTDLRYGNFKSPNSSLNDSTVRTINSKSVVGFTLSNNQSFSVNTTDYERLLNTTGCYMLNVFEEIKQSQPTLTQSKLSVNHCRLGENLKIIFHSEAQKLKFIMREQNKKCCFISIEISELNKTGPLIPPCVPINIINEMLQIQLNTSDTSILLSCNASTITTTTSHHLILNPVKETLVQEKIQHWEQYNVRKPTEKFTFSIFTVIIDGFSRIRARQQLPLSLQLLQTFNFSEMKGYHLTGAKSMGNFIPLVTGWTFQDLLFRCKQMWDTNVDTCPFAWRQFDSSKFITVMAGDTLDIVNPFKTGESKYWDYTVNDNAANILHRSLPKECNSTTRIERIFTILQTILKSYSTTPKFTLLWINETTLEDNAEDFDPKLRNFLFSIVNNADILKNTLIHFATHTSFSDPILESDIGEHRLPTLFARLPENINSYQNVNRILNQNENRLVTPFTVHDTFRWFWNLYTRNSNSFNNSKHQETNSLLDTIPASRTCKEAKIPIDVCGCQPVASMQIFSSDEELGITMSKKSVTHINNAVLRSFSSKDNCTRHDFEMVTMLKKFLLDDGGNNSNMLKFQYVVNFRVVPSNDVFQATFIYFPNQGKLILGSSVDILNRKRTSRFTGYCHNF